MSRIDLASAGKALSEGSKPGLMAAFGDIWAGSYEADFVPAWVDYALNPQTPPPRIDAATSPFLDNIKQLRNAPVRIGELQAGPSQRMIGRGLDFLGEPGGADQWSPVQCLNYLMMAQIRPRRGAAVVGTMRDDGIYAIEWIAHHLALGFEHVFIYTNDNADGSEQLLRCLASHGAITLIESETAGTVAPEIKAFEHAVQLLREARDFEWILFVDSDEFLMPAARYSHDVGNLLAALSERHSGQLPSAILFEWLWYVSGMVYERRPGTLVERFQHARPHWLTKTLVRLQDLVSMRRQHYPELKSGRTIVNSAFDPFDLEQIWKPRTPCYEGGWVAHFWPKSFEEFSLKKARGDALKMNENGYKRDFSLFFRWNGFETADNQFPADPGFLAKMTAKIASLRRMAGVAAAELAVNQRFGVLLGRYEDTGGLRQAYDRYRRDPAPF